MRTRTPFLLLGLCITGFAFSLYCAGDQSGTESGNLWLLTSLIVGLGLIATALSVIAHLGHLRGGRNASEAPPHAPARPRVAGHSGFHADLRRSPRH